MIGVSATETSVLLLWLLLPSILCRQVAVGRKQAHPDHNSWEMYGINNVDYSLQLNCQFTDLLVKNLQYCSERLGFVCSLIHNIWETAEISMRPLKHKVEQPTGSVHAVVVSRDPKPPNYKSTTHWSSRDNPTATPSPLSLATRGSTPNRNSASHQAIYDTAVATCSITALTLECGVTISIFDSLLLVSASRPEEGGEHLSHAETPPHCGVAGDLQLGRDALHGVWVVSLTARSNERCHTPAPSATTRTHFCPAAFLLLPLLLLLLWRNSPKLLYHMSSSAIHTRPSSGPRSKDMDILQQTVDTVAQWFVPPPHSKRAVALISGLEPSAGVCMFSGCLLGSHQVLRTCPGCPSSSSDLWQLLYASADKRAFYFLPKECFSADNVLRFNVCEKKKLAR